MKNGHKRNFFLYFNCANAIAKMPGYRRSWQRQLSDDFIRAIHLKKYRCKDEEELNQRLDFIQGHKLLPVTTEDDVVDMENEMYGKRTEPVALRGIPRGYVPIEAVLKNFEFASSQIIPFPSFYSDDQKKEKVVYSGCYLTIIENLEYGEA